jgi:stage II sporulation protein D
VFRGALLVTSVALLGFGGVASARLVAEPTTTEQLATGPGPLTTGSLPATTAVAVTTTRAATTTHAVTTTSIATTTTSVATTTTTAAAPALAESTSPMTFFVTGHGWGHGVGLAQWGANGYARSGSDYRSILLHYYQGTTIEARPAPVVRVLLADGRAHATLVSGAPWKVVDARRVSVVLPAGPLVIGPGLVVGGKKLVSPLSFSAGATPLSFRKTHYRGSISLVSNGKRLQVVNVLPLESYVLGVVGREMPSNWPTAALEAQAVATRSYALAELEDVVTAGAFDLYDDTRSQVYGGVEAESPAVTAAVRATARQVVLYGGKVATTYFSSSSGGQTESAEEAWGKPVPYLQSVPDPYDTLSPYHNWGPVLLDARKAARALKVPGRLVSLNPTLGPSGRVVTLDAVGTKGDVQVKGADVRTALGLRSTWFTIGELELTPPPAPLAYGGGALTGVASGADPVSLEAKAPDGTWQTVSAVQPASDGTFSITVRPTATTSYRLAAGQIRAAPVTVPVAPLVSASLSAGTVLGSVKPALPGASVQLQRQDGVGWKTVASGITDGGGSFAVTAQLSPGAYRVRCAPGHGLSPGVSQPLIQS